MVKARKVYSCYYCRQAMLRKELNLVNVSQGWDKQQKELVCCPCQRWCEIGSGIETMEW